MKKTISVIFALLLCVSVLFTGCNKGETPQGGVVDMQNYDENAPVVVKPEISIQEGETVAEVQLGAGVEAFISNAYWNIRFSRLPSSISCSKEVLKD